MPLTTNANYDVEAAKPDKKPRWLVEISGISDILSSGSIDDAAAVTYKKYLSDVNIDFSGIDWKTNIQRAAAGSFTVLDKSLYFSAVLANNNLFGKQVVVKHGFKTLAVADFVQVYPQLFIENIDRDEDGTSYIIKMSDMLFSLDIELFRNIPTTNLDTAMDATTTTASVYSTTSFIDPSGFNKFSQNVYIKIDSEYMKVTAKASGSFTVTRGQFDSTADAHSDEANVKQIYMFGRGTQEDMGHIHDLILWPLLTTAAGTNGIYDAGLSDWGAEIPESRVDVEGIISACFMLWAQQSCTHTLRLATGTFVWTNKWMLVERPERASAFIERMLNIINCVLYVNATGKLSIKRADWFILTTSATPLADKKTSLTGRMTLDTRNTANAVAVSFESLDPDLGRYLAGKTVNLNYTASVSAFGLSRRKPIQWPCRLHSIAGFAFIASELSTLDFVGLYEEFLWLHGDVVASGKLRSPFMNMKHTPGDVVQWNDSTVQDPKTGTRGVSNESIVLVSKSFDDEEMQYSFLAFRLYNKLSTPDSFGFVQTPNVQTMTFSADKDETLEAGDAYRDLPSRVTARWWKVTFELTPPASGSAKLSWIKINLKFFYDKTTAITASNNREFDELVIHYDPSISAVLIRDMYCIFPDRDIGCAFERVKADWYAASESSGSGLRPSLLRMTGVSYVDQHQRLAHTVSSEE